MNRKQYTHPTITSISNSIPLPAIKLVRAGKVYRNSAVHIGWLKDADKPFCLCGCENGTAVNTSGTWYEVTHDDYPEITCERCKHVWYANRARKNEAITPQTAILHRIIREHLKSEGIASRGYNPLYENTTEHPSDDKVYEAVFKEAYNRRMKSDATLIAVEADGHIHLGRTLHRPSQLMTAKAEAVCNHKLVGDLIGCTEEEYKLHKYITCPDCIAYIKDNDLDVEFHEMEQRHRMLEALKQRMEHYKREFDFAKKQYEALIPKTIISLNA